MPSLKKRLETAPAPLFVLYGGLCAFCIYFSMYAFRKPYAAATYEHVSGWHYEFGFKDLLVIAQILGYALSKFIGVKVISEMPANRRCPAIVGLIVVAWLGLVLFAVLPAPIKFVGLLINGLPLGLIWGLVFAFLEGRRTTEILGAILSASFIVSSGIVKTVAIDLMDSLHVPEFWMPATTGALFFPLLVVAVWGISMLPKPNDADIAARTERKPMNAMQRRAFLVKYGYGIAALVVGYILLTVFRDFRDDFAVEIWTGMGRGGDSGVLTQSEIPVGIITLLMFAGLILIKDNVRALMTIHAMTLLGGVLMGVFALAYRAGLVDPLVMMIGVGTGLYIAYMPFGAMLFERLIASTRQVANAGFLIYVADASGYFGTVTFLIFKNVFAPKLDWTEIFLWGALVVGATVIVSTLGAAFYFQRTLRREAAERARLGEAARREGELAADEAGVTRVGSAGPGVIGDEEPDVLRELASDATAP